MEYGDSTTLPAFPFSMRVATDTVKASQYSQSLPFSSQRPAGKSTEEKGPFKRCTRSGADRRQP